MVSGMATASKPQDPERIKREIDEILQRVDSLPVLDSRTEDEILSYGSGRDSTVATVILLRIPLQQPHLNPGSL